MVSNGMQGTTMFRGLLALAVALEHADLFGVGFFPLLIGRSAVIGFFVLSGWVMAWYFYAKVRTFDRAMIIDFFIRRAWRLGPLLLLNFLLVSLLMGKWMFWELGGLLPLSINPPPKYFNIVLWTLFVEIQFYICVPLLAWVLKQRRWDGRGHLAVYALLFLVPRLVDIFVVATPVASAINTRSFFGNLCFFYVGLAYCRIVTLGGDNPLARLRNSSLWQMLAAGMVTAAALYPLSHDLYFWIGVHGIALMSLSAIELSRRYWPDYKQAVTGWIKFPWLLGEVSYGYYIFHGICMGLILNHVFEHWGYAPVAMRSWAGAFWMIIMPMPLALFSFFCIEKPVAGLRFALFKKKGQHS